ncbi:carboxyl-terminal processing protease [Treponema bryantii]|uniref:Carboxyl-terminal processing protease n=1 Tax=Treponema bryantii TaxID=163 RepID=A0A1H9HKH0_9SPIR|nr:S41 family peptidase [Treponema bryantii]BDC94457.1 peptidase S41 [Treponema bryantii]SEQ62746.1 carboxyl-terminal processing protease [Treponema bryantii]
MKKIIKVLAAAILLCTSQCFAESSVENDSKITSFQYVKKLNSVFDFVQQNYVDEIDPKILYEGALKGMLDAIGDPYTLYLDEAYMRDLSDTTSGSFGGVGLSISKAAESTPAKPAYVEVASPIEDTPGAKAGIQAGDLISAIDGMPTPSMTMNEVLQHLRGEIGTPVTVTILRGTSMKFDVTLIRALIEVPTVKYGMIEGTKIGYARLIQFTPDTALRLQDALDSFEKNGYNGLIIDLRDNPGGLITSAVDVADKFIDAGPIVSTKSRLLFENSQFSANKEKTTIKKNIPIVVLINRGAASASEIVSGALKDYHLAYLVGERTYGKGSVQQVIPLSNTDGIKITMARYYTPSDMNIDKIGIPPDQEVKNLSEFSEEEEKLYVDMIKSEVINKAAESKPNMTEADIALAAIKIAKDYPLDERLIRRLIRIQVQKTQPSVLYDLDYDLQLNAAIKAVQNKDFAEMLKNTKTLRQLQEEVEEEKATEGSGLTASLR